LPLCDLVAEASSLRTAPRAGGDRREMSLSARNCRAPPQLPPLLQPRAAAEAVRRRMGGHLPPRPPHSSATAVSSAAGPGRVSGPGSSKRSPTRGGGWTVPQDLHGRRGQSRAGDVNLAGHATLRQVQRTFAVARGEGQRPYCNRDRDVTVTEAEARAAPRANTGEWQMPIRFMLLVACLVAAVGVVGVSQAQTPPPATTAPPATPPPAYSPSAPASNAAVGTLRRQNRRQYMHEQQ
jgi:hypothetical protein